MRNLLLIPLLALTIMTAVSVPALAHTAQAATTAEIVREAAEPAKTETIETPIADQASFFKKAYAAAAPAFSAFFKSLWSATTKAFGGLAQVFRDFGNSLNPKDTTLDAKITEPPSMPKP